MVLTKTICLPHRGFFTEFFSLALQEASQGRKILVVQFLKGGINQGIENPVELTENLIWLRPNIDRAIDSEPNKAERREIQTIWQHVCSVAGDFQSIVLDEVLGAVQMGLISAEELSDLIKSATAEITIVGPYCDDAIAGEADQVIKVKRFL